MLACINAFMLVYVYVDSECHHSINIFSQFVCLSIERHSIILHMNTAGFAAAYPANGSTVEGRPTANVMLVHHCGFRLLFGGLSIRQLEFQELVGFLKATERHCRPTKER